MRRCRKHSSPAAAVTHCAGLFTNELFTSSRAYALDKWRFAFLRGQVSLLETVAQLWFGFLPWLWYSALPRIAPQQLLASEISRSICFVLLMSVISMLTSLPWSYYSTCTVSCGLLPATTHPHDWQQLSSLQT